MIKTSPQKIRGPWDEGYALDFHTISSELIGYDEYGHAQFDTKRTEIGELLYRLKYRNDRSVIPEIVKTAATFIQSKKSWTINLVIPVPPSNPRGFQPVIVLAEKLASTLGVRFCGDCVTKIKNIPQLKNVYDASKRRNLLSGVFQVDSSKIREKSVLLFDDLYRSGATLNEVFSSLQNSGTVKHIFALALTTTRAKK